MLEHDVGNLSPSFPMGFLADFEICKDICKVWVLTIAIFDLSQQVLSVLYDKLTQLYVQCLWQSREPEAGFLIIRATAESILYDILDT